MRKIFFIVFFLPLLGKAQFFGIPYPIAPVTAQFFFSSTAKTCSGWTNLNGNPITAIRSTTDPSGITITSVATANYTGSGGVAAFDALGTQAFSVSPFNACGGTTSAIMYNSYINIQAFDSTKAQLRFGGLDPTRLYTITASGATVNGSVGSRITYIRAKGGGNVTPTGTNYNPGDATNGPNTTTSNFIQHIQPNGSGQINLFFGTTSTQQGILSAIQIKSE